MGWHQILNLFYFLLFFHLPLLHISCINPYPESPAHPATPLLPPPPPRPPSAPCPPDQRDALLYFANSFVIDSTASPSDCPMLSRPRTKSWNKGVDCCWWDEVICDYITGNIIMLDISCSWLRGTLHPNISFLLPELQYLLMPYNSISGKIPRWFWGMNHDTLEALDISQNQLEGGIPHLHWKRLSYLNLSSNHFTGEIPSSICQLSSLQYLCLDNTNLSGNVPSCFGNITSLLDLSLRNNKLEGTLPRSLVKLVNLYSLDLSHNKLSDIFPHWLEALQLASLFLDSNNFHGEIYLGASRLRYLSIRNNNFTGRLPIEIFSNTSLNVIDLANNKFEGPIPLPSPFTFYYSIASNNFIGKIPSLLCNATKLQVLDWSNNGLTGSLPQCLTNFSTDLQVLNIGMNHLEGTIPQSFSSRNNLMTLDFSRNWMEGTLPRSLVECDNLEVLDLSDNQVEDTFPRWLGTLPNLKVLVLRSNKFKDLLTISREAHLFPMLHILDLSNNNFGGPLPINLVMNLKSMMNGEDGQNKPLYMTRSSSMGWSYENSVTVRMKGQEIQLVKILTIFTTIDLSNNSFHGDIPRVIGHLNSLIGLNLSHNNFTGPIPLALGNLTNLGWLDLSSNKLSGVIPRKLGDLTFLGYLNLSKNQLIGRIPQDKQLSTFSNGSFNGNPGLCGTPLSKACLGDAQPPPPSSSSTFDQEGHENWYKQKVVWMGYASGIIIGISIAYIAFETRRPKWLAQGVRMLERRVAKWMEKPKQKAIKFHK